MGTASTMNALAESLGMALPGSASIPAAYRERGQMAYMTGKRIVEMVHEDLKPSDIMTRQAFENSICANSAIGGSTNAPIHINAIARHIGVELNNQDWQDIGYEIPLLLNIQPAGEYLCEEYHRAGGLPAIMKELLMHNKLHGGVLTCTGKTMAENLKNKFIRNSKVIYPYEKPLLENAGFLHLKGTLFDSAIMKMSVINDEFRKRFLQTPKDPNAFEGKVAVFEGPEDYHSRIDNMEEDIDEYTILIMRGTGPLGYPGAAEVVNMQPPARLIKRGVLSMPCIGDGRQSGTSGSPSILNASPEAAIPGSGLGILKTGDRVRIDLNKCTADILIPKEEFNERVSNQKNEGGGGGGGIKIPPSQTPWQDIFRREVGQLDEGMVLKRAVAFQRIAETFGVPRDNH